MASGARGGRGGARGGRSAPGTVNIGGVELNWDLSGLDIKKTPAERYPPRKLRIPRPPTEKEKRQVQYGLAHWERAKQSPLYADLNDGMKDGFKPKGNQPIPTEDSLFNTFTDNETYSSKYSKVEQKLPRLDQFPFVKRFFPKELWDVMDGTDNDDEDAGESGEPPVKKRKLLPPVAKETVMSRIDRLLEAEAKRAQENPDEEEEDEDADEDEEDDEDDEKPDAVNEDDDFSAASSGSEESGDDYNAEQYFDNGDEDDFDDADPYENTYE